MYPHVIFPKKLNPGPKEPWLNYNIRSSWVKLKSEPFEQLFLRVLKNNIFMPWVFALLTADKFTSCSTEHNLVFLGCYFLK
jgi:hypothetical protein